MAINKCTIYIGTSGWSYGDWADGVFYPEDLKEKDWLKYYSRHFKSVEINATFYHQMSVKAYQNWHKTVPKDFVFAVKISRFLTHVKKLNEPKEPWQRFINNAKLLKEKLGPILVQLPPNFKANTIKLENLLKVIPKPSCATSSVKTTEVKKATEGKYQIALEVRDESWFCDDVYKILKKYNTALVFADSQEWPAYATPSVKTTEVKKATAGKPVNKMITADFIYIRMHGPGDLYGSKYTTYQLKKVADNIKKWKRKVKQVYVYFNNDTKGYAVENAHKLRQLVNR